MGIMICVTKDGSVIDGIPMDLYSAALLKAAKKYPGLTLNFKENSVIFDQKSPSGWVHLSDAPSVYRNEKDEPDYFSLAPGQSLRFQPDDVEKNALAVQSHPSGLCFYANKPYVTLAELPQPLALGQNNNLLARLGQWLHEGDIGSSAMSVVDRLFLSKDRQLYQFQDLNRPGCADTPRDQSDWDRMARMVKIIPEVLQRIDEMEGASSEWSSLLNKGEQGERAWDEKINAALTRTAQEPPIPQKKMNKPSYAIRKVSGHP